MRRARVAIVVATSIVACGRDRAPSADGEIVASIDFTVTPSEITLGDVSCGAAKTSELAIANRGGATLTYSVSLPDGSPFVLRADKTGTLASGAGVTLPIDVVPGVPGEIEDTATVDVNGIIQQVTLRARGVGAVLVAEPQLVDFGEVRFDRTFAQPVALRNIGNAPAVVEGFEGTADAISVGPNGTAIDPGGTGTFTATIGAGAVIGTPAKAAVVPILASSTAHCGTRPTIDVTALRVDTEVTLSVADFGQQSCGTGGGATRDVVVTNYSNQQLTYSASLPADGVFTIAGPAQGTIAAAAGATPSTAKIAIAMGPTGTVLGVHEEALTLQIGGLPPPSGGTRTTRARLDVRGAIIAADPMELAFDSDGKKSDRRKIKLTNGGNEPITLRYAIEQSSPRNPWSLDATTQVIAAGAFRDLTIFFLPSRDNDAPSAYEAKLKVVRDGTSSTAVCSALPEPRLEGERTK